MSDELPAKQPAESEAWARDRRLGDALEVLPVGVALLDAERRLILCNAEFRRLHAAVAAHVRPGMVFDVLLGLGLEQGLFPLVGEDAAARRDWLDERLEELATADGQSEHWLAGGRWVRHVARRSPDGCHASLWIDVTDDRMRAADLRRARDELERRAAELTSAMAQLTDARLKAEQALRAKSDFLSNMSHELRTPLNAIVGFTEIMRHEVFGPIEPPRYAEYARHIADSARHLLDLINDVLDYARIEAGARQLDEQLVALDDLTAACLRMVSPQARAKDLTVEADLRNLPPVKADPRALRQVLLNLLSNAIKFTPQNGRVDLIGRPADGGVKLMVRDTGIGIPEEDLDRVMDRFAQVRDVSRAGQGGTGLGLAISRALIEQHGGRIGITSRAGAGTTVWFTLPPSRLIEDVPGVLPWEVAR